MIEASADDTEGMHRGRTDTLLVPVAFVTDEHLVHALGGMLEDIGMPGPDVCPISL